MGKMNRVLALLTITCMIVMMIPCNALASYKVSTRLSGNTAVQTAQAIAQDGWTVSMNAVIAPAAASNILDALAAAPLAAALNAPVLLTDGDQLSTEAKDEITRLGVETVYVTSGLAVIKAGVISELQGMGVSVVNLGGLDQYETSVNIAKEITKVAHRTSIFIANGEAPGLSQDALSVAAIAGAQKQPLLLTQKGQLPKVVADYINSLKGNVMTSYIIGGTGVVSDAVKAVLPGTVYRTAGNDAYDTNLEVLKNFKTLNYNRIFVANGETMIEALVGAPLAAQTNAPVILVNGSVKPATLEFLKTKETSKTVVTALGGVDAVPENIRNIIANPDSTAVVGTTSNLYEEDSGPTLGFTVGGVEKTAADLTAEGFNVEFQANEPVFYGDSYDSPDGTVNMDAANFALTKGATFNYVVVISQGDNVVTSAPTKVTVKAGSSDANPIESIKIFLADEDGIDGKNVEIESGTLTSNDEAYLRVRGINSGNVYGSITKEVMYESSEPAIAYVDKGNTLSYDGFDYAKIVLGGETGTVTITITTSNGSTQTLTLEIVDETRKISADNTTIDMSSDLKLAGPETSEVLAVTVKDQFDDPIKGYIINPRDAISNSETIAQAVAVEYDEGNPLKFDADVNDANAATDYKGRVVVLVKGGKDDGTATMRIQDQDSETLDSIEVSNRSSFAITSDYELNLAPFRTDTLDASDSVDKITYLKVDTYDSEGYKTSGADLSDVTVKIDDEKIVDDNTNRYITVDASNLESDGYIKVTAKKIKSDPLTISLYQGDSDIELASAYVTVEDNRPEIEDVTFESSIPTVYSSSGIKLDRVLKTSGIETDNNTPVTFEYVDPNQVLIHSIDDTIIGDLRLSVVEGDFYPTFKVNEDGDIRILLEGSDEGESGIIRLTVNNLTGEDADGVPSDADSVGFQNISVTDLAN